MNKFKSVVIGVALALAVLWCLPNPLMAQSVPQGIGANKATGNIAVVTGGAATWGSSGAGGVGSGRLSSESLRGSEIAIPAGKGFMVYVGCDKGLAADGDSVHVFVETTVDGAPTNGTVRRSWVMLGASCSTADSTDYPMVWFFTPEFDSTQQTGNVCAPDGGGVFFRRGASLGRVRIGIHGAAADSTADGVGRWPYVVRW